MKRATLIFISLWQISTAEANDFSIASIKERVDKGIRIGLSDKPREGDVYAAAMAARAGGENECWAIIQLFKWKCHTEVALRWWESDDRINRTVALICMSSMLRTNEGVSVDPFVNDYRNRSERFNSRECSSRIEELDLVYKRTKAGEIHESLMEVKMQIRTAVALPLKDEKMNPRANQ